MSNEKVFKYFWQDRPIDHEGEKKAKAELQKMESEISSIQSSNIAAQQAAAQEMRALAEKAKAEKASNEESLKQFKQQHSQESHNSKQQAQAEMARMQEIAEMQYKNLLAKNEEIEKKNKEESAKVEAQRQQAEQLLAQQKADFSKEQARMKDQLNAAASISQEEHERVKAEVAARTEAMMQEIRMTESNKATAEARCDQLKKDFEDLQQENFKVKQNYKQKADEMIQAQARLTEQARFKSIADCAEASRLEEKHNQQSIQSQSLGCMSKTVLQARSKAFLNKGFFQQVAEQDKQIMRSLLNRIKPDVIEAFQNMVSPENQGQASSANGPFVLGTGCSEVCPLIAFLQGSQRANSCWLGPCKGTGLHSSHNKVTYQFCFDQNDPSKMKVVSFAPHVANN